MFQEKQSCSTSMIMQPHNNHGNEHDLSEESITNPTKKQSNISADKKVLGRDFAVPDASLFKVTRYLQRCLAFKRCSASSLNCRYLNPYIKLKLIELAIKPYQEF